MLFNGIIFGKKTATAEQIFSHLKKVDNIFVPNLSTYVDLERYSKKLSEKSITFEAWINGELIGLISVYFELVLRKAFISNLSIVHDYSNNGVATFLLSKLMEEAKEKKIKSIELEVFEKNIKALDFYKRKGFILKEKKEGKYTMAMELSANSIRRTQSEIMQSWAESALPLVSINSIAYNHAEYIRQAIDGFLMQKTNFAFEVLIHDDASTDGTADIIREYAEQYPDIIKPIYQTENQYSKGVKISTTFNFPRARGKYLAICEGDDYWTDPLKLQKQVDYLEANPDCSVCFHPVKVIYEDGSVEEKVFPDMNEKPMVPGKEKYSIEDILYRNFIQTNSVMYRWDKVENFPEFMKYTQVGDYPLHVVFASKGNIGLINETMSVYRKNSGGVRWFNSEKDFHMKTSEQWFDMILKFDNFTEGKYSDLLIRTHVGRIRELLRVLVDNRDEVSRLLTKYKAYLYEIIESFVLRINRDFSTIFVDSGKGFNLIESETVEDKLANGRFEFKFNISAYLNILRLRFDPYENRWGKVKVEKILYSVDGVKEIELDVKSLTSNGRSLDECWIEFETFDPRIYIPLDGEIKYIKISGERELFSFTHITKRVREKEREILQRDKVIEQRDKEIFHLRNSYPYKIGKLILFPVRVITKLFSKK